MGNSGEFQFWLAMAFMVVLLALLPPQAATWLAVGLVVAAISTAQLDAGKQGHTFFGDLADLIGGK